MKRILAYSVSLLMLASSVAFVVYASQPACPSPGAHPGDFYSCPALSTGGPLQLSSWVLLALAIAVSAILLAEISETNRKRILLLLVPAALVSALTMGSLWLTYSSPNLYWDWVENISDVRVASVSLAVFLSLLVANVIVQLRHRRNAVIPAKLLAAVWSLVVAALIVIAYFYVQTGSILPFTPY